MSRPYWHSPPPRQYDGGMSNSAIWNAIGLGLLGLIAGSLSGLLGIGGAVVIIPALVYVFG